MTMIKATFVLAVHIVSAGLLLCVIAALFLFSVDIVFKTHALYFVAALLPPSLRFALFTAMVVCIVWHVLSDMQKWFVGFEARVRRDMERES